MQLRYGSSILSTIPMIESNGADHVLVIGMDMYMAMLHLSLIPRRPTCKRTQLRDILVEE